MNLEEEIDNVVHLIQIEGITRKEAVKELLKLHNTFKCYVIEWQDDDEDSDTGYTEKLGEVFAINKEDAITQLYDSYPKANMLTIGIKS
jgi:ribosomal protein S1